MQLLNFITMGIISPVTGLLGDLLALILGLLGGLPGIGGLGL